MAGSSQRDSKDELRHQLEHIELQDQQDQQQHSLRPQGSTRDGAGPIARPRPLSAHFDTPDDTRQSHARRSQPALQIRTSELYTIQSQVPVPPSAEAERGPRNGRYANTPSRSPRGRVRIDEPRVSLTLPRQTFDETRDGAPTGELSDAKANASVAQYGSWVVPQKAGRSKLAALRWGAVRTSAEKAYTRYILEGLLRQRPIPPSRDGRHIPLEPGLARRKPLKDERTGRPYVSNFIRSSRYTLWNFLPKQIFFQFSKLANFYFLIIGILQMIPGLSTTGTYTTIGPLIAFVALSMAKEGYDDYRRYRLDRLENRSSAWVLDPAGANESGSGVRGRGPRGLFRKEKVSVDTEVQVTELQSVRTGDAALGSDHYTRVEWQDLRVGDIIRLQRDENVPADIVLLHATGPNGVAYIETMALDGETNLKSKQACSLLAKHCSSAAGMRECGAEVVSEDPNMDLYNFEGRATVNGETMPLTMNEVVYRGSTLRNTREAIGLVINSGEECKIRMNANKNVRAKAPEMQHIVNRIVIALVFFVLFLSVGCTVSYTFWRRHTETLSWYLLHSDVALKQIFIGFLIAFNTLIPLSLYVSHEIVKIGQLLLLSDIEMYDPVTDTPMVANTTTILENLGQVSYVFSDKTGTLTENLMKFRKISVAGTAWLHDMDLRRETTRKGKKPMRSNTGERVKLYPKSSAGSDAMEEPLVKGGVPRTASFARSKSHRAHKQPELKTDELIRYITNKPHSHFARKTRQFILCLALCHTCLPETNEDGEISFQAASPDELALVEAAKDLGYLLVDRAAQSITLQIRTANGSTMTETYEILDVIEFSSKRKRMSIIVRMPDGKVCIFTKGADSVILPRLRQKQLAMQTASAVERKASIRRSVEQERALRRQSLQSPIKRDSMHLRRALDRKDSWRRSAQITDEVDTWLSRREAEGADQDFADSDPYQAHSRRSVGGGGRSLELNRLADAGDDVVDESLVQNDAAVFERCFQHVDDFASEGLRTLIFGYRYLDEDDYRKWKAVYHQATTSLVKRQERIEDAAELIEQDFDLAGATAIEDKLQQGVPETIDKLRRANIKVWMLTGDKRETAINIAHSARICKPFSEVYILDEAQGDLHERLAATLTEVCRGMVPHSVAVIDGHTLSVVEDDPYLRLLFFDLVARVDSVICCRASPAQKAKLVQCVRYQAPSAVTLAIGDGANDIAMIQASHVGIGISGREGLQAARISDFSIAQFRFLQRLLFVHGRWNYVRSGKYILGTFWKEVVFYLIQAHYQRYNGFTGTSLFESTTLTVFNTLFTSLPVIIPGIFERDLSAETLLAVPELYSFGQKNKGFNFVQYLGWMVMAVAESAIIYYSVYYLYASTAHWPVPTDLYPVGTLAFSLAVVFINLKLMFLEVHDRTLVLLGGMLASIGGWWLWNMLLSALFKRTPGPYIVRDAFLKGFGRQGLWWLVFFIVVSALVVFELGVTAVRKSLWPTDRDLMQEMEHVKGVRDVMREHVDAEAGAADGGETGVVGLGREEEDVPASRSGGMARVRTAGADSLETVASSAEASASVPLYAGGEGAAAPPGWQRWDGFGSRSVHGASGSAVNKRHTGEFVRPPFTPPAE